MWNATRQPTRRGSRCADTSIPTSVQVDENGFFIGVNGDYRVYDVKIFDKASGTYKELDRNGKYIFAGVDYYILSYGSGMSMFKDAIIVGNEGLLDVEALEMYITDNLKGVIGEEYKNFDNRITFTDGKTKTSLDITDNPEYAEAEKYVLDNG